MTNSNGLWNRIPLVTKVKIIIMGALVPLCLIAVVIPNDERAPVVQAPQLLDHAELGEWNEASSRVKSEWARAFTREQLGRDDREKADDIVVFLDSSAQSQRELVAEPEALEALSRTDIRVMATAGARIMGWSESSTSD